MYVCICIYIIYMKSLEVIKTISKLNIVNEIRCEIDDCGDVLITKIMLES